MRRGMVRCGSGANPHACLASLDASGLEAGARSPWSTSALGPADRVTRAPASSGTFGSELVLYCTAMPCQSIPFRTVGVADQRSKLLPALYFVPS